MRLYGTKGVRPQSRQRSGPNLEEVFALQIRATKLPAAQREYLFHHRRKWKFDFAWPQAMIAVEIEGGTYVRGRHVRPEGFRRDCQKYNSATLMGWRVLRGDSAMVKDGSLLETITEAMNAKTGRE